MKSARRLAFGLSTLAGRPRGWFIPYRHADASRPQAYPALEPLFTAAEPAMRSVLQAMAELAPALAAINGADGGARFDQDWFPTLDAAAAYTIARRAAPARIVEIGCGHSTRFLARAIRDGALPADLVCVDPAPRAAIGAPGLRHVASLLADADPAIIASLAGGDILFVDSSHVAMPGTDVDRLILDIFPRLPSGVLAHLHDIFLPDPYPAGWSWRGYNEQLVIGALLQGAGFEIVFASRWLETRRPEWLGPIQALPRVPGVPASSLWLRKR